MQNLNQIFFCHVCRKCEEIVTQIFVTFFQKATNAELLARVMEVTTIPSNQQMSATDLLLNSSTMDFMDLDFNSDTLFNTLNQPFAFPNPKEFCE